jgi:hypothetical protein
MYSFTSIKTKNKRNASYYTLLVLFVGISGIFDDKNATPIGIPYITEIFQIIILLYSLLFVTFELMTKGKLRRLDALVVLLVFMPWGLTALNAYITYSQPLIYGLIEDRRISNLLIYFPIVYFLRTEKINDIDIIKLIMTVAIAAMILSFTFISLGLVSKDVGVNALRDNRLSMGLFFIIAAVLSSYVFIIDGYKSKVFNIILLTTGIFNLIFIVQTRKVIIVTAFLMLVYAVRRGKLAFLTLLIVIGIVGTILLIFAQPEIGADNKFVLLWMQLLDEDYLTSSARAHTLGAIYESLLSNPLWGSGALSLQWNNGFSSIYGDSFFLADVGLAGAFFRYGIPVSIIIVLLYAYISYYTYKMMNNTPSRNFVWIATLFVFLSPGAGIFLYAGTLLGISLGIASGCSKKNQKQITSQVYSSCS